MFTYSQYWKNNDIEKHFKKYAQKRRLGNVSLLTSIRNILGRLWDVPLSTINIKNCNRFNILVKNENGEVAIDTLNLFKERGDFCDRESST